MNSYKYKDIEMSNKANMQYIHVSQSFVVLFFLYLTAECKLAVDINAAEMNLAIRTSHFLACFFDFLRLFLE